MSRAGSTALTLLAAPLNVHILQALEEGPRTLLDLRRTVASPPESTMRLYSRILTKQGVVDRRRRSKFPSSAEYELTLPGRALLGVAKVLEEWLQTAPDGEIRLGSAPAKSAIKALVEGWSNNIIRALAARPLSQTELNRLIPSVSYPALERRLASMRLTCLLEPYRGDGRGMPYTMTKWLRWAVVPLAAAASWEQRYQPEGAQPIDRLDVQAAFLLAIPLINPPADFSGKSRLTVELQGGSSQTLAGVLILFKDGGVASCTSRLDGDAEAWASGSPAAWLNRLSGVDGNSLELGGDVPMAQTIIDGLGGLLSCTRKAVER
jgi:DNA-binding HxlR family transcriptional regulator